jgi:hypothetical protein
MVNTAKSISTPFSASVKVKVRIKGDGFTGIKIV